jgi:hypothetical protein
LRRSSLALILALFMPLSLEARAESWSAQRGGELPGGDRPASLQVEPLSLTLEIGETAEIIATVLDENGTAVIAPTIFLSRSRRNLTVTNEGRVDAVGAGDFTILVRVPVPRGGRDGRRGRDRGDNADADGGPDPLAVEIAVTVLDPPLDRIEVIGLADTLYAGSLISAGFTAFDQLDVERPDAVLTFETMDPEIAGIDRFGLVSARRPGSTNLRVTAEDARGSEPVVRQIPIRVEVNPAIRLELAPDTVDARTGDVIRFEATGIDRSGVPVADLPVFYTVHTYASPANPAAPSSAEVTLDGRFVAELPGRYRVLATSGWLSATATIDIEPRNVAQNVRVLGREPMLDQHTSDLWVWESSDGRDYAITGTWRADGHAYVWDVTDSDNIEMVDSVQVDARTVNDVKVSADGNLAVISREGASNRQNGVVLLDISDPSNVTEISSFSDELTGGVHNTFLYENHLYALSAGRRYDIINVAEPGLPFRVGRFELDTPAHSIHDVWVDDGIAYSSNWNDGVVLVDVGNGIAGGSPGNPVQFAQYADPFGHTHAAFPFRSESTGKFYVIMGDEYFPTGFNTEGPTVSGGYMHIVDFSDLENPLEVARFEVPEAGSHNLWVEGDVLYAAFYNGGLRVVDLSGELMGDLFRQGREIASFVPKDAEGVIPNESMVWGAQPHKDAIYLSDWNSGLWVIQLTRPEVD